MHDLLDLLLTPLRASQEVLCRHVRQRYQDAAQDLDSDEVTALREALQDPPADDYPPGWWLDPHLSRWWLCLHVDWKASDEVHWQAQAIARTLGLDVDAVGPPPAPDTPMLDALAEASSRLHALGYALLYLDTDSDEYLAVPVRHDLLRQARDTAERLNLPTFLI